ncbi:MAG: SGNH/GDSL hydrolase family protein [Candidatus Omnitrophica bacterium]|nr:SGNH/GDSL hydrolase family protein [Candidatus Omnitrophota bacterium]MDD5680158.1 SGNH/GDSL hydrolase family protein [Candidatus Omnitrophota bacterium]
MRKKIAALLAIIIITIIPILVLEGALRLAFGFPHGSFNFLLSAKDGLYPRNENIVMEYGFRPYRVITNSYGMRSKEIRFEKTPGVKRVVALGDSVTDGYFVDNDQTYPFFLEGILTEDGYKAEVLSVARGGGSIDKELALLKVIAPLKPDIVVLTFVTNDIWEIMGKDRREILNMKFRTKSVPEWFLTKAAIGELVGDIKLKMKYKNYKLSGREKKYPAGDLDLDRLGRKYDENAALFKNTTAKYEGRILNEPFSGDTEKAVSDYLAALDEMNRFCGSHDIKLVMTYFPSYSQVYDLNTTMKMRDILKAECEKASVPFCDLTEAFRREGRGRVLYFAPFDFHCNGEGNRLIAGEVAGSIEKYL